MLRGTPVGDKSASSSRAAGQPGCPAVAAIHVIPRLHLSRSSPVAAHVCNAPLLLRVRASPQCAINAARIAMFAMRHWWHEAARDSNEARMAIAAACLTMSAMHPAWALQPQNVPGSAMHHECNGQQRGGNCLPIYRCRGTARRARAGFVRYQDRWSGDCAAQISCCGPRAQISRQHSGSGPGCWLAQSIPQASTTHGALGPHGAWPGACFSAAAGVHVSHDCATAIMRRCTSRALRQTSGGAPA
jgi:hypothetical protein